MWQCLCSSEKKKSSIGNSEGKELCQREPKGFRFVIFKHEIVNKCFKMGDRLAILRVGSQGFLVLLFSHTLPLKCFTVTLFGLLAERTCPRTLVIHLSDKSQLLLM